jgi:ArsR family transcriptional regulator, virulence genes transcriptional regulator
MTSKPATPPVAAGSPELAMQQMREHACAASGLLKAMGNEQRLLILCQLVSGEASVGQLQAASELSQSALSQHLAILRESALVTTRRVGQSVVYALPPGPVQQVMATLHQIYCGPPSR